MIIKKEDILREERKKKGSPPLRFSVETGGRRRFLRDICRGEETWERIWRALEWFRL